MRLLKFLALVLVLMAFPALAQEEEALYRVTDVAVDVSATSAAQARDQAILQAQRNAFTQLMQRLGAEGRGVKANDDMVAEMVKAFEVQKEHALGQRYTGLYTVQFKPDAVRGFLGDRGVAYVETRARPVVVLPVLHERGRDILWEDRTAWQAAWEEAAKAAVLVPVIVPQGDLDDIAKISAAEAVAGKAESLQALIQKYQAGGALVVVLRAELDAPDGRAEGVIEARRYDLGGKPYSDPVRLKMPAVASAKDVSAALAAAVKQVIAEQERGWQQVAKNTGVAGPANYLPVDVPVPTLAAWAQIRGKLAQIPQVSRTHVVTMTRGLVHIELEFHGDIPSLQTAIGGQGLSLQQGPSGGWEIR